MPARPRWTITLQPAGDGGLEMSLRMKRFLKIALRSCGLVCVGMRLEPEPPATSEPVPPTSSHSPRRN